MSKISVITYPEADFLEGVFNAISNEGCNYCVLRNYETLPAHTNGSDIDVLICVNDFKKVHQILASEAALAGGRCICRLAAARVQDFSFCGQHHGKWWGVRFDTFTYAGTNGCDILPAVTLLKRQQNHSGIKVANQDDNAVLAFLKEVIGSGHDLKNYRIAAKASFQNNSEYYSDAFATLFGRDCSRHVITPLLTGNLIDYKVAQKRLRICSGKKLIQKRPFCFVRRTANDVICKIKRVIDPPGFSVVVLGTDGSGKSTIIGKIKPILESALHTQIRYEHMRPNVLPSIARLFGRHDKNGIVTSFPHSSGTSGFLGSFLRLSYYTIDYIFGYWSKVHIDKAKNISVWIFDRYFYDFQIDPKRARINLPHWLIVFVGCFIPKPELILCLGTDSEVIHDRKPELPLEEVKRQVSDLKRFCAKTKNAVWIDTGCTLDQSVDQALEAITSAMASRYEKNSD